MTTDFAGQRAKMVDGQVRTVDVTNLALLSALLEVPREAFAPDARRGLAYIDEDLLISDGPGGPRYMMEAGPFARLVQLADIRPGDFVLDVGCGTGYSSAVLSRLASSVVALESDQALADAASATLSELGYDNVAVVQGPLAEGYPSEAPYDVIIVEGGVDELPAQLAGQLREGGRLVVVEGSGNAGVARLYVKARGLVSSRGVFNAAVKPLPGFQRAPAFEF